MISARPAQGPELRPKLPLALRIATQNFEIGQQGIDVVAASGATQGQRQTVLRVGP